MSTLEAALWLVVLLLFLDEVSGATTSLETNDKNDYQSRRKWCEETNACAGCEGTKRPKCLNHAEPLLGADLCQCCFSCVALRDLGESCGSQLSTWPDISGADPVSSTILILATTRCRDGLVCVNFTCLDSSDDFSSAQASWLQNYEKGDGDASTEPGNAFLTTKRYQRMIPDDPNLPIKKIPESLSTPITPTLFLPESKHKPQPCYAEPEKPTTFSSYQSDDLLGRVATTIFNDQRFQLVYTGDLLSDMKALLNVVDTFHSDSPLNHCEAEFLLNNLLGSDGFRSEIEEKTVIAWNAQRRSRREVEIMREDAGFAPPGNIQEILIRGASAHQEYVDKSRSYHDSEEKNDDVTTPEVTSQEDESTVRLHITNHPRKVQTLVDLEEDEEEEVVDDEDRRILHSANRGLAKEDAGRFFPVTHGQTAGLPLPVAPKPSGPIKTTPQSTESKKFARIEPQGTAEGQSVPLVQVLALLDDRLTLVEIRLNSFEQLIQEISKWINSGPTSTTRDCFVPQTSDIRFGRRWPETDEHIVLASGIDPVRIRGGRRKVNGIRVQRKDFHDAKDPVVTRRIGLRDWREPLDQNIFRTLVENGSSRRRGSGRPVKSLCRSHGDAVDKGPVHRTVHRSISTMNTGLENSTINDRLIFADGTQPRTDIGDRSFPSLQETQIPLPGTVKKETTILQDRKKRESSTGVDSFPGESASAIETTTSRITPPWKMVIFSENEKEYGVDRMLDSISSLGVENDMDRTKRVVKEVDDVQPALETSWNSRDLEEKLFERESAIESDADQEQRKVTGPLIVNGNNVFRKTPDPMTSRLFFRNSNPVQTTEPTATQIHTVLDDTGKASDPKMPPYSITDHGNSTIRIEEISETEYDDGLLQLDDSLTVEDDFDHLYENVEATVEDGEFDYDVANYDQVDYVDGSSVEMATKVTPSEEGSRSVVNPLNLDGQVHRDRNRRDLGNGDDEECESGREAKREIPLVLFGSSEKHEPKTIVWPSKWTGYRRDRILESGRSGNMQGSISNPKPLARGSPTVTTTSLPTTITGGLVVQNHFGNGEASYEARPKILGLDRRGRKKRRKLV